MRTIEEILKEFDGKEQGTKFDRFRVPANNLKFEVVDIDRFNEIYQACYNSSMNIIQRTPSGGIKKGCKAELYNSYAYDVVYSKSGIRLTVIYRGFTYVIKVGALDKDNCHLTPANAWKKFIYKCAEQGLNIYDYMIDEEEGLEAKTQIESPLISMKILDTVLENVHHIDFHNSYPAGLCNTHPEFRPIIEPIYKARKDNPENKAVLNYTIGAMQSPKQPWCAKWAHLSRDAINDNNRRVKMLSLMLVCSGRTIVGYNTDGIWYQGEVYHGPGEGDNLGEWHNDHINCTFRAKSSGIYEFIENGKYTPVVRGSSTLDLIQPDRSTWHWGDIYKQSLYTFKFEEGVGIIRYEKD